MRYLTINCVRCGDKFRFWTKGKIYPIICEDCYKSTRKPPN